MSLIDLIIFLAVLLFGGFGVAYCTIKALDYITDKLGGGKWY